MPDEFWKNLADIIIAFGVIVSAYLSYRNARTLGGVEKKVDGMSSDLVAATKDAEFAKGKLDERDAERLHLTESPPMPIVNGSDDDALKVKLVKGTKPKEKTL